MSRARSSLRTLALAAGVTPRHAFDRAGDAFAGETVCTPSGTGARCGTVLAVNGTVASGGASFYDPIASVLQEQGVGLY